MNQTARTVLIWVLILVIAVGLWNLVEHKSAPATPFSLTDVLNGIDTGTIAEVRIAGSQLTGRLVRGKEEFRATIPPAYTAIYDKLAAANIKVTVMPTYPRTWPTDLLSRGVPVVLAFALGWLCASRTRRTPTPA
jgi:ATP-dependent Zn protease